MKGYNSFLNLVRALRKSGKLDDATSRELNITVAQVRHNINKKDRRGAERHFDKLCDLLSDILDR